MFIGSLAVFLLSVVLFSWFAKEYFVFLVFLSLLLCLLSRLSEEIRLRETARIVPLYQRKGSRACTFSSGVHLFKNLQTIDEFAKNNTSCSLSEFIVELPQKGPLTFFDPQKVLDVVEAIIRGKTDPDSHDIRKELRLIRTALLNCTEHNIGVVLVLREGLDRAIVPIEMQKTPGTFW
jgi:hypothetical protein